MRHCVLSVALLTTACLTPARAAEAKRPNVIFILADDLGWGDLACYGHPHIKTPNLDKFAKQGTLFTQFYVAGSVCSPSRCAFMTSRFPARFAIHGHLSTHAQNNNRGMPNWLDPRTTTLPRLLKDAGYATAHFGKWHLGSGTGAPPPGDYGFDDHKTINSNGPTWDEADKTFRAKSTAAFVDETVRFIKANRDKPFYVNLWTLVPHATLNPTDEQLKPYERFQAANTPHKSAAQIFYASVTDLDTQVGRLMKELDALGVADDTIVLFSSDNGPEDIHIVNAGHSGVGSAGPFRGRKRSLYEGGVRVPFIVRWPGKVPADRVDDTSVLCGVDFLPTLCKAAGVKLPADLKPDGEDMSDVLGGKSRARTTPLMWEWRFRIAGEVFHHSPMLAIRDGDWKLLLNPDRSRVELYDVPRDPTQMTNLAEKKPDVVERLAKQVLAWQKTLPEGPRDAGAGKNDYPWPGKKGTKPVAAEPTFSKKTYTYKTVGDVKIEADVHRAEDDVTRPVLVWIHGGALINGSRNSVPRPLLDLARKEGYALVSLDYRLAPEVKLPAIIEDVEDAFAWLRDKGAKELKIDPRRVVVAGGSAGGYLTLMTGCRVKPRPLALVSYWGYGDVDGDWYTRPSEHYRKSPLVEKDEAYKGVGGKVLTGSGGDVSKARGRFYLYLRQNGLWTREVTGFDPDKDRKKLDAYCPVRSVAADYPPTLLIHGTADTDVPYELSAAMAKELLRQKVAHELVTVKGAGHGLFGADKKLIDDANEKAAAFIREHLKEARTGSR